MLRSIQRVHPNLSSLRSLLSGILTPKDENSEESDTIPTGVVTPPIEVVTMPPASIINALARSQGEGNI